MTETQQDIQIGLNLLVDHCHKAAKEKGFWDKERNFGEAAMLVVTELAEAVEGERKGNGPSEHIPEFSAVEEEIADAIIRLADMAGGWNLRLGAAIIAKLEYNASRPYKHGKKF